MFSTNRRIALLFVSFGLLVSSGCVPGVTWLPDSSGFVFVAGKERPRLHHYDLATGESRVLVPDLKAATLWPAVSPDGKRVAVARYMREQGKPETMQVTAYDLTGKETHRSPIFTWRQTSVEPPRAEPIPTTLYWTPAENLLLVHDFENNMGQTGLYDLNKRELTTFEGIPCAVGNSPIRPDGKGFLLVRAFGDEGVDATFVEWNGVRHPLTMEAGLITDRSHRAAVLLPYFAYSQWEGSTARIRWNNIWLNFDTDRRVVTTEKLTPETVSVDGKFIRNEHIFPGTKTSVRALHWQEGVVDQQDFRMRLELRKGAEGRVQVLAEGPEGLCLFSPAPTGKHLAVRVYPRDATQPKLLLIDEQGDVKEISVSE